MSDESEIESQAPLAAYPDHAAELQDIVQGVARLRRWSRFSVLWIVAACLCVFGAILFAGARSQDSEVDEAMRNNARVSLCFAAVSRADELTARAVRAETEAAELRRENDELKRAVVSESRKVNVRELGADQIGAVPEPSHVLGASTAPSDRISATERPPPGLAHMRQPAHRDRDDSDDDAPPPPRLAHMREPAPEPSDARIFPPARASARARDSAPAPPEAPSAIENTELVIIVKPWAVIWLDGKLLGQTPLHETIAPGRHRLRIANDDVGKDETIPITVHSGMITKVERSW